MNVFDIEESRQELLKKLTESLSTDRKIYLIQQFLRSLLNTNDNDTILCYLIEIIPIYLHCLSEYSPFYKSPEFTEAILSDLSLLFEFGVMPNEIVNAQEKLRTRLNYLLDILKGTTNIAITQKDKFNFPVLETGSIPDENSTGFLANVTIDIKKNDEKENKFMLIPSGYSLDERMTVQINTSWDYALQIVNKYIKIKNKHFTVIINFDKKDGIYVGDSLGTALCLSFIEKLLEYYNAPYVIQSADHIAFTGGLEKDGTIIPVSGEIISKKTDICFYSNTNIFVLHPKDLLEAENRLNFLKSKYPSRNLQLLGVSKLQEILNRRDLIAINKINSLKRGAHFVLKQKTASLLFLLIILGMTLIYYYQYDDNPASFQYDGNNLAIINQSGRVLFKKD